MLAAAVAHEQIGEDDTGGGGLPAAEIVERNVLRALQPAFRVPRGFAMADVVDSRHALPRSLPDLTRQSIFFVRFFCEEGWMPGSSPGMTISFNLSRAKYPARRGASCRRRGSRS